MFNDPHKRKINLGGTSSSALSHTALLGHARALRNERIELQRRHESAARIQAWWRARGVRGVVRVLFREDVRGMGGLRALVVLGSRNGGEEELGVWSAGVGGAGEDALWAIPKNAQDAASFPILLRQVSLLLLRSVSSSPLHPNAITHLQILSYLLTPSPRNAYAPQISTYLLHRDFHLLLARAIGSIPVANRAHPALPALASLLTAPFTSLDPQTPEYAGALTMLLTHPLALALLPNRLPTPSLVSLSSQIPFSALPVLDVQRLLQDTNQEAKRNLLANLQVLVPPRYKRLSPHALSVYLGLISSLVDALPPGSLTPTKNTKSLGAHDPSSSDDEGQTTVTAVSSFTAPPSPALPPPDARTLKRLLTLPSPAHLSSLLSLPASPSTRPALFALLLSLSFVWPAEVPPSVLAGAPGMVRELYRGYVRGRGFVPGDEKGGEWVPFLLLVELYASAMRTMGDDEFFGTREGVARNPMGLDELAGWGRQMMGVAWGLWSRDQLVGGIQGGGGGGRWGWEEVRERVTRCLVGIHARDSRKPFVPPGHWLVTAQMDVQSFVEAAIFEERELSSPTSGDAPLPPSRARTKHAAHLSPRLNILNRIPFALPFATRVSVFRSFVLNDAMSRNSGWGRWGAGGGGERRQRVQVRRGSVAQDGFDRLGEADLKRSVEIVFVDQWGGEEAGIDGGGVFKEFFTSLCREVFDTDRGLWLATRQEELYPNPHAYATEAHSLNWYRFIGRILGKAMYEGILVDVAFAGFFLAKWLGKQSFLDDLASLDPDLYNGLVFLKHYTGNLEDLALNFTIAVDELGTTRAVDLIPNGSAVAVTKENRLQYIQLVAHFRLTKQIRLQSEAFFEGLSEMIEPRWIRMFNQQEMQILLGGVNTPIDFDDLRGNTNYGGLYDDNEETIVMFWNVVNTFDQEQRMALLRFVTSCSRPPLLGFKELVPNFSIRDASSDQHRLPTSSTCVNLLKLPRYKNAKVLRDKLLQAINANAGFDLS
ncbi:hypothetical protein DXG01_002698 [Tephrocybe rancida]|nr:hypothetical protein DXG01_002698 [Tephrocybe rancida]